MAADQQGDVDGGGPDRISDLPDHLLHTILLLIPYGGAAAAAARTSVLSRRWRHVWAHLPELALRYDKISYRHRPSAHERVGAALGAYAAPTLRRLEIAMPLSSTHVTAAHVSSWLRFASQRLAGELKLVLPSPTLVPDEHEDVVLPPCERATAIDVEYVGRALRFRLPAGGGGGSAFAALATLRITCASVDNRELEGVLSSRCPRLKELVLECIDPRDGDGDAAVLTIRSGSLQRLRMAIVHGFHGLFRVATPELQVLNQRCIFGDAHIAAPKLSELYWLLANKPRRP